MDRSATVHTPECRNEFDFSDLIENIHAVNERNQGAVAASAAASAPPLPIPTDAPDPPVSYETLLQEIHARLSGQIHIRVDEAVARFTERLASLAKEQPKGDDSLLKTQEIDYPGSANPDSQLLHHDLQQLAASIDTLDSKIANHADGSGPENVDLVIRRLDERMDELKGELAGAFESSAPDSSDFASTILERFTDLESNLAANWETLVERISRGESALTREGLDEFLAETRSLVERMATVTPRESTGEEPGPATTESAMGQITQLIMSLKKEFSLLVHTINAHLEETRNLSDEVTASIQETVVSLQTDSHPEAAVPKLQKTLEGLEELKTLPEKISAILTAAEELNQQSLTRTIEEAMGEILKRFEGLN